MIALCSTHHDAADAGAFTKEQLQTLKRSENARVGGTFQWRRKHTVFGCGGNYAYRCNSMLRLSGIDIVYFEKDAQGFDTLSLNIYDVCLNRIFEMRQNDWIARTDVDDLDAPPSQKTLIFKSKLHQINLTLEFKDRSRLCSDERHVAKKIGIPEEDPVVFCLLTGSIAAPLPVTFYSESIKFLGITMSRNIMVNSGVGVNVE